jgi:hypothetical protein
MDPDGSYYKKSKSSEGEAKISPLHEASRGTPAMPILNDHVDLRSSSPTSSLMVGTEPIIHAPKEASMLPVEKNSLMPYQRNLALSSQPPSFPHTTLTPSPGVNNIESHPNSRDISRNQQEMLSRQAFLGKPVGNYLNSSQQMQMLSMEPPSFTSLLQEDPVAVVHAHLHTLGGLDEGPIYEMPTLHVSEVHLLPSEFINFP